MHVLFIIDPLPALKAYKDSSVAMMRALVARGHTLSVAYQSGLFIDQGVVKAATTGIDLVTDADLHGHAWWRERSARQDTVLSEFAGSEGHTSELQALMSITYAVFCWN